jgi:serine/threonine protein kinase
MELADYDLEKYYYKNTVNPNRDYLNRIQIFKKICLAVKHAHDKDIVHRDLYWNNILIKRENNISEPKLNDFGLAKDFNLANLTNLPMEKWGAPFVRSPEIIFKIWQEREIDKYILADLYALGIVFSCIFNGLPMLYIQFMQGSLTRYLTLNNISIDALSFSERKVKCTDWITTLGSINPASYLFVSLINPTLNLKVNSILNKLCSIDYNTRYQNIDDVLIDLNSI